MVAGNMANPAWGFKTEPGRCGRDAHAPRERFRLLRPLPVMVGVWESHGRDASKTETLFDLMEGER